MGKTHSKPLAARHGRGKAWQGNGMGAAWARHTMCESALIFSDLCWILLSFEDFSNKTFT